MFTSIRDWFTGLSKRTKICLLVIAVCSVVMYVSERVKKETRQEAIKERVQQENYDIYMEVEEELRAINAQLDQFDAADIGYDEIKKLEDEYKSLYYHLDDEDEASIETKTQANKVAQLAEKTESRIQSLYVNAKKNVVAESGILIDGSKTYAVHLERGECLYYDITFETPSTVRIYNYDKEALLHTFSRCSELHDSLPVRFPAVYLVEITTNGKQYADISLNLYTPNKERYMNFPSVREESSPCQKGDFMARKITGVRMLPAFEEPRKLTLRSNLKSAFSGNSRVLVPIQVPTGATDILYNLRISTNERPPSNEEDFYKGMEISYNKIKILGLPLYESTNSSGLLSTLLGMNTPVREEEAYVNMCEFYNAAEARKFQNGTTGTQLKYNLDYSTLGTQSCNGRIPCKGHKTVYLGFENERMRYSNYIWLSALLSTPQTEYVRMEYTVE